MYLEIGICDILRTCKYVVVVGDRMWADLIVVGGRFGYTIISIVL